MIRNFLVLALLSGALAQAQSAPTLVDSLAARSVGRGGAFRALGVGPDAVLGNPASMGLFPRFTAELTGGWDVGTKFGYGQVVAIDTQSGAVGGGLGYQFVSMGRREERRVAHHTTVAVSVPLTPSFILGASARHIAMLGAREANAVTTDFGAAVRFFESFHLSVSGHNLIDIQNPDTPRYYALGLAFLSGPVALAFDVRGILETDPALFAYQVGAEYVMGDGIPIRIGYTSDQILGGNRFLSFGLGVLSEGGTIDFAYRHELGGLSGRLVVLSIGSAL